MARMNVYLLLCIVGCNLVFQSSVVRAAVAFGELKKKPEKFRLSAGCYIERLDQMIPVGEAVPVPGHCSQIVCHEDKLVYHSCAATMTPPERRSAERPDLPYPDCCPGL